MKRFEGQHPSSAQSKMQSKMTFEGSKGEVGVQLLMCYYEQSHHLERKNQQVGKEARDLLWKPSFVVVFHLHNSPHLSSSFQRSASINLN
jgi:hypothetical protein